MTRLLIINPGSTSTKAAIYLDDVCQFEESISHSREELAPFPTITDQLPMRLDRVRSFLKAHDLKPSDLDLIVSRGGTLPPVERGAYLVDENLVEVSLHRPALVHASNLGAAIAHGLAKEAGIQAYIYDCVSVDELLPVARFSGVKDWDRTSFSHALNTHAVALRVAKENGLDYEQSTFIVAHLGGGISMNVHQNGHFIEIISSDEGPFSTERAGAMPIFSIINMLKEGVSVETLAKLQGGTGGLISYLDTNDAREVERRIDAGDEEATLVFEAMGYQIARSIGSLAPVVKGKVDGVILTGGMAHSKRLTAWVKEQVEYIAPVSIYPGELEMQALAEGGLRVFKGEETARRFEG